AYFYPAVSVDSRGNIILVFNRSGANEFPGIFFTGRKVTDAPGKLQPGALLKASASNYQAEDDSGRNRWGDYNSTAIDPADGSTWVYSEFATSSSQWATQVGKLKYP